MKLTKRLSLLIAITIFSLSLLTKSYYLSSLPPSLFSDEVDATYQALVFNNYQSDYFGNKFPIHFHSFSDWRTPLYIYSISFVSLFTKSPEIAARLPAVIFMSLSSVFFFLILKRLSLKNTPLILATLAFTLNPWLFHYGRTAFEVSGMLFAILAAIHFLLCYLDNKKISRLYLSIFFFALAPLFYSTAKLSLLFLALSIFILWRKEIFTLPPKKIVFLSLFALLCLSPLIIDTLRNRSAFRFSYISIFSEPNLAKQVDYLRYQDIFTDHVGEIGLSPSLVSKLTHNRYSLIADKFISNYISSFSTDFLLLKGDSNLRHGFSTHAYFYLLDTLFFFIGLYSIFKFKSISHKKISLFFLFLLLTAPIPFSLTRDSISPHATRLILMAPAILFFISLGIATLYSLLNNNLLRIIFPLAVFFIYSLSFYNFFHQYRYHYPQLSAMDWHTGIKESVLESKNYPEATSLYFSNKYEPVLPFFLLYQPYLPEQTPISDHILHTSNLYFDGSSIDSKYYFGEIKWSQIHEAKEPFKDALFILPKSEYQTIEHKNDYTIQKELTKKYINQSEFIILKLSTND